MCDNPLFVCKESFNDGWDNNWGVGDHMLQGYGYHRQQEKSRTYVSLDKQPHVFYHSHLGPVYTTVEKASGRSRMLGQDMVI